ncbi:hypothetical protein [Deinococcus rubellus]|uniref:hypothetical protein n=1 Tax=Deinococcus rubellus TaxID=1889240 RepID=UPI0031F0004D
MLTEDIGFRHSNREGYLGVPLVSCGVMDLLMALSRAGHLDQPSLDTALFRLLRQGHRLVPLSPSLIEHVVKQDHGQLGPAIQALIATLVDARVAIPYQTFGIAYLLYTLWAQLDLGNRRHTIVRTLMAGLEAFPDREQRLVDILIRGQQKFRLLSTQWQEVKTLLQQG